MTALATDIDRELNAMDQDSAQRFERAVRHMLLLMKNRSANRTRSPLPERIANHPAIGTWPKDLDPDSHIAAVRAEWE